MKTESLLFAGVATFFLGSDVLYMLWAREPAGTAALTVAFLMASLVSLFCAVNYRRKGNRPEDRKEGEVRERAGLVDFFPPQSPYPPLTGLSIALTALGVVFGLWLFLIGFGLLATTVIGMSLEFNGRG